MSRPELHPRTAVINKVQKNQSKKARLEALDWLAKKFPKAFDNTISIHPLKIGIVDDVLEYAEEAAEHGISRSKLREALVLYTRRIDYLSCLKAREMRIDLLGNPVSRVTEQEAEKAALKIKKRVEKSLRNARKTLDYKTLTNYGVRPAGAKNNHSNHNGHNGHNGHNNQSNHYPYYESTSMPLERPPLYAQNTNSNSKTAATVVITHKTTRQYDPEAVARLKEKLGLAQQNDAVKEG
jgi:ProP effector